jgi:zinc-ribbon domain
MFCEQCGKSNLPNAQFCNQCGNTLAYTSTSPLETTPVSSVMNKFPIPEGVIGWSWGAFIFGWFWAICNKTWIGLLTLVPGIGFIMHIILGFKGREWAWQNDNWESVEHFKRVQKRWSQVALGLVLLVILSFYGLVYLLGSEFTNQLPDLPSANSLHV